MPGEPCLRSDLSFVEQVYRGERSYVVKDLAAQKYFRFGATEVRVMRAFDGERTPHQVVAFLGEQGIRVSAQLIEGFARKLASAGFLERSVAERSTLQMERLRAERRKRRQRPLFRGEILRMRWSFGDPDAMLTRMLPRIRWMFTPGFVALSVALFAAYLLVLGQRWDQYAAALASMYSLTTIGVASIAVFWITTIGVVLIHELGHGFTCKYYGGEVHELGFMLLYFQPAFYCDVSDAWSFPARGARLWVTAAGSWIQLVVTSIAALVWWAAAPDTLVAQVCVAAMLIGGAMTLFTNMNPLLPLDGYFALTDWLEIPNLRHRAFAHVGWWFQRRVLRLERPEPAATRRERRVFMIYGALATVYIGATFALFAALLFGWAREAFGAMGIAATAIALVMMMRGWLVRGWRTVALVARTHATAVRRRLGGKPRILVAAAIVIAAGFLMPWTLTSSGSFVVHPATSRVVTAPAPGLVTQVLAAEGASVPAGAPVARIVDRALERALLDAGRTADSLATAEAAARAAGRAAAAEQLGADRRAAAARWAALEERERSLTLRAPATGVVLTRRPEDLVGHRVQAGDSLLHLGALDSVEVRVALTGAGATRAHAGQLVNLVPYADVGSSWRGRLSDVSTAASRSGMEARIRIAGGDAWRPGVRGEASVELERSTVLGALWWKLRQLVRGDLWL